MAKYKQEVEEDTSDEENGEDEGVEGEAVAEESYE